MISPARHDPCAPTCENHLEVAFRCLQRLLLLALAGVHLAGCAWIGGRDGDYPSGVPLPYSVGVYFDSRASSLPESGSEAAALAAIRFQGTGREIAESLARTLTEYPVASQARVVEAADRTEALGEARRNELDYVLYVGLKAPASYEGPSRPAGYVTLEIISWLFGGIPSWFVPTLNYRTETELSVNVVDMNDRGLQAWWRDSSQQPMAKVILHKVATKYSALSLWDRSGFTDKPEDYALSIIMPPMFIHPADASTMSQLLTENVLDDLEEQMAEALRSLLVDLERKRPLSVIFNSPLPGASLSGEFPGLQLDVASRGGVSIQRLDLQLLGSRPFRWAADAAELQRLNATLNATRNATLAAGTDKPRAAVNVPIRLPLVQGQNRVRVRLLREDGERLTRTVIYHYDEE